MYMFDSCQICLTFRYYFLEITRSLFLLFNLPAALLSLAEILLLHCHPLPCCPAAASSGYPAAASSGYHSAASPHYHYHPTPLPAWSCQLLVSAASPVRAPRLVHPVVLIVPVVAWWWWSLSLSSLSRGFPLVVVGARFCRL
jgi:hypothetical protein